MKISMLTSYLVFQTVFTVVTPTLWRSGVCYGRLIEVYQGNSSEDCLDSCIMSDQKCEWATFESDRKVCHLSKACYKVLPYSDHAYANKNARKVPHKILTMAGSSTGQLVPQNMVEIVDISGQQWTCDPITIDNVTDALEAAIGGLVNGIPTICGGSYPGDATISKACFQLEGNIFKPIQDLDSVLHRAASAKAGGKLFVSGGFSSTQEELLEDPIGFLENRFFQLSPKGSVTSKEMPAKLARHCMVAITDSKLLVIGGYGSISKSVDKRTWLYAPSIVGWTEGPNLTESRMEHACAIMTESDGTKYIVVAGGNVKTTLFLEVTDDSVTDKEWQPGPDLQISEAQMVTDPATGNVILIGGKYTSPKTSSDPVGSMYRLENISSDWKLMDEFFLKTPRSLHVSFFVPDDKLPCQKTLTKAKETNNCRLRDDDDDDDDDNDDLVEFCQL